MQHVVQGVLLLLLLQRAGLFFMWQFQLHASLEAWQQLTRLNCMLLTWRTLLLLLCSPCCSQTLCCCKLMKQSLDICKLLMQPAMIDRHPQTLSWLAGGREGGNSRVCCVCTP